MKMFINFLICIFCFISMMLSIRLSIMWNTDNCIGQIDVVEYDDLDETETDGIDGMKWGICHYNVNDICSAIARLTATLNGFCIILTIVMSIM